MNDNYDNSPLAPRFAKTAISVPIILGFFLIGAALIVGGYIEPKVRVTTWSAVGVMFLIVILFGTLTVKIYDHIIIVRYGIGIFQKTIPVHAISDHRLVQNRFLSALYNLGAEHVLKVSDRSGRSVIIGLGDAKDILDFLRSKSRD